MPLPGLRHLVGPLALLGAAACAPAAQPLAAPSTPAAAKLGCIDEGQSVDAVQRAIAERLLRLDVGLITVGGRVRVLQDTVRAELKQQLAILQDRDDQPEVHRAIRSIQQDLGLLEPRLGP